ncbi:MAG: sialidase family protein [Candidatus Zixiibacteriota bacterium]
MKKAFLGFVLACLVLTLVGESRAIAPPTNIRVTTIPQLNNEEQVWICPTDSNIIIANWRDFRLGYRQIGIGRSTDGGLTWNDSLINNSMQYYTQQFPFEGWQSDPTMSVNSSGHFYISALDFQPSGPGSVIAFYKSTDKGISWTGPVIHALPGPWFEDKQFTTVDRTSGFNGYLYCSWTRFPDFDPDQIAFVRSTNGGASFDPAVIVGPVQTSTGCGGTRVDAGQFSIPVVTPNGDVHVFWQGIALDSGTLCTGRDVVKHVKSSDGGISFTYEDTILSVSGWTTANGGIQTYSQPVADADITSSPFSGNLYVCFTNIGPEDTQGRSDVDFVRSTDNGATWSARYRINDDSSSEEIDNFHPWLICNEEGVLATIFYDQRNDPPAYYEFDLSAAYSFDGGLSFTTNHRISSVSSSPDFLKALPPVRFWQDNGDGTKSPTTMSPMAGRLGEYIGVTAFHDKINAVWTDTRNGNSEVYTANWYLPILEPRLVNPPNQSQPGNQPLFSWATAWKHNDDRYRLELFDATGALVSSVLLDTTFHQFGAPLTDSVYTWRVKAFKISTGDSSGYSPVWKFRNPCCLGLRGNVDGDPMDIADISDLSAMVDYLFAGGSITSCLDEANTDADIAQTVDISDLTVVVDYLFTGGSLPACP